MPVSLTKENLITKYKIEKLEELKNLNLWGNDLEDVEVIKELPNLEVIGLSVNNIKTLKYFSFCPKLIELYLRKNYIDDLKEINYLKNCKMLKILWLEENPICNNSNYREYIINALPQLVKLDNIPILDSEREKNRTNEIPNNSTTNHVRRSISPCEPRRKINNNSTFPAKEMLYTTPNINDYKRSNRVKISIETNNINSNNVQSGFTFSQKKEKFPKQEIANNQNSKETKQISETDYINQLKNMNEVTSYFAYPNPKNNVIQSNINKRNEELLKFNKNIIHNSEKSQVTTDEMKILNFSNGFNIVSSNQNSIYHFQSNKPNDNNNNNIRKTNKSKSNLHLIKAIFNLLEELDKPQLIYLRNLIESNLSGENNEIS